MLKIIVGLMILILTVACELGEELDVQDMGNSAGYFVECYCEPGEMFNLTATRLAPIAEDQVLDYSLEFTTHITTNDRFRLYHSLFAKPGSRFIYNYASNRRLCREDVDTIFLDMKAPDGSMILGKTSIPDDVHLDSTLVSHNQVYVKFTTSQNPEQNYFILYTQVFEMGKPNYKMIRFLGGYTKEYAIENIEGFELKQADSVVIVLKRLTEAGYRYQLSMQEAENANQDNLVLPAPLAGNLDGAIGIFTCYTNHRICVKRDEFVR